jgi:GTP-binding protein Era
MSRCGLVAVLGAPNAGKSTLVNALVGQKVAIVSPKAQTTRARLMGIALEGDTQILLIDTPGIFAPHRRPRPGDGEGGLGRRPRKPTGSCW